MASDWLHHRGHHLLCGLALAVMLAAQSAPGATAAPKQETRKAQQPRHANAQGKSKDRRSRDVYTDLARATGGFAYNGPAKYLDQTTDAMLLFSDRAAQSLTWVTGTVASPSTVEIPVAVDSTVTELDFVVDTYKRESAAMELLRPDSTPVTRDAFDKYTSVPTLQHLRLLSPAAGQWTVRISGNARYELSVFAKSKAQLDNVYFFPLISEGETLGPPRIGGALPVQQKLRLEVGMKGIREPVATLMLFDGTVLKTAPLRAYKDDPDATRKRRAGPTSHSRVWYDLFDEGTYYFAEVFFSQPSPDFRVVISGKDVEGLPVTRLLRRVFNASDPPQQAEPEPTPQDTDRDARKYRALLVQAKHDDVANFAAYTYLKSLPTKARLALGRSLADDADAMVGYSGCQILIAQGHLDEAVPHLAAMIVDGRAQTQLNGRMGYDWAHSDDNTLFPRAMLEISKYLLAHLSEYDANGRRQAELFLAGPQTAFTEEAARQHIKDLEEKLQEIVRRTETPANKHDN